jgi:hypothetical protein
MPARIGDGAPSSVRGGLLLQAVFTNSVFVLDWNRPAPLTEFFVPALPELHFPDFRDCIGNSRLEPTHWVPHLRPMRPGDTNMTMHIDSLHRVTGTHVHLQVLPPGTTERMATHALSAVWSHLPPCLILCCSDASASSRRSYARPNNALVAALGDECPSSKRSEASQFSGLCCEFFGKLQVTVQWTIGKARSDPECCSTLTRPHSYLDAEQSHNMLSK